MNGSQILARDDVSEKDVRATNEQISRCLSHHLLAFRGDGEMSRCANEIRRRGREEKVKQTSPRVVIATQLHVQNTTHSPSSSK